jgi:putative PIN family toxin of toxin-antitoxin system
VRIVLDTNVFISGIFFTGPPHRILTAWHEGELELVASAEILDEYRRVGRELSNQFPGVDLDPLLALLVVGADLVIAPELPESVSQDPDDDKFLACALAGQCQTIVSGDKHLKKVTGYRGVEVLSPRAFVDCYLDKV